MWGRYRIACPRLVFSREISRLRKTVSTRQYNAFSRRTWMTKICSNIVICGDCCCSGRGVAVRLGPGVPGLEPGLNFAGIDKWTMAIEGGQNKPSWRRKIRLCGRRQDADGHAQKRRSQRGRPCNQPSFNKPSVEIKTFIYGMMMRPCGGGESHFWLDCFTGTKHFQT